MLDNKRNNAFNWLLNWAGLYFKSLTRNFSRMFSFCCCFVLFRCVFFHASSWRITRMADWDRQKSESKNKQKMKINKVKKTRKWNIIEKMNKVLFIWVSRHNKCKQPIELNQSQLEENTVLFFLMVGYTRRSKSETKANSWLLLTLKWKLLHEQK